jgi:hypothetical protein
MLGQGTRLRQSPFSHRSFGVKCFTGAFSDGLKILHVDS